MKEYLAIVEEATRGTDPGSGYKFLPIKSGLVPKFEPKDEPRAEFRGTVLGKNNTRRISSAVSHSLEAYFYPGDELGLFFQHLLGGMVTRATLDTSAYKGLLYPVLMPYGDGAPLTTKAIGAVPNTNEEGTTKSQYFGGERVRSATISIKPDDDVSVSVELGAPGAHVGAVDQTAIGSVSLPWVEPFTYAHAKFYIDASGPSRTGSAPEFSDIDPSGMTQFFPDEFNISITNGLGDKDVLDVIASVNGTVREGEPVVECDFSIDYRDPSTGFSPAAQFKSLYSDAQAVAIVVVLEHTELAGAATEKYKVVIDLPLLQVSAEPAERDVESKTPVQKFSFKGLSPDATMYPVAMMTIDQASAY